MTTSDLLPCPFCGVKPRENEGGLFHPEGDICLLEGLSWSADYYRDAWNTRTPTDRNAVLEARGAMAVVHQYRSTVVNALAGDNEAIRYAERAFDRLHEARRALASTPPPADEREGERWPEHWRKEGFNGAVTQAARALRFLAEHDRPSGGEQFPNSACCYMIADELDRTKAFLAELDAEIERLKAEVTRLDLNGIHTCHDQCPKIPCVQRRTIAAMREAGDAQHAALLELALFEIGSEKSDGDILADSPCNVAANFVTAGAVRKAQHAVAKWEALRHD